MIVLNQDLYIAKGADRECYINPIDNDKIIKILYNNNSKREQNNLDIYYYNHLKNKKISYANIAKYYGTIKTNKGVGLVFSSIKDYNGALSKSFEEIVVKELLSVSQQSILLNNLSNYLSTNMIVFGDVVLSNILCQEFKKDNYKLVIIDGLGARRFGFKLWMHKYSKLYTKFRIKKQWKKLMINYRCLIKD